MVFANFMDRRRTQDLVRNAASSFAKLHLSDTLRRALLLAGYRTPSPIQETAIPLARQGTDLIVRAQSGSGKTLVFALACVDRVNAALPFPQALILTPTREIAQQNATEIRKIAQNLPYPNLTCGVFTGGVAVTEDRRRLRRPCQVVVGTPGRLCWLVQKNELNLNHVRLVVLDGADQLYSESLKEAVQFLLSVLPAARQSLAFSATYSQETLLEIEREMDYPQRVFIEENEKPLIGIRQCYKIVEEPKDQEHALFDVKLQALIEIFSSVSFRQALVLCNLHDDAEALSECVNASGFPSALMSNHKSQEQRNHAMHQSEPRVIVSTDPNAKGIDLEHVNLVCSWDLPFNQETYQQRNGRFGTHGISVTLVTASEKEKLEHYSAAAEDARMVELPREIPKEWYKDPFTNKENQSAYEKLVEPSIVPEAMAKLPMSNPNWSGAVSKWELLMWKGQIEKKFPFWNHWDPYSAATSRSSSREGVPRLAAASELSCETGSASQRRTNCIRLPSQMSHSTSASSIVYSEEGECECLDVDEDQMSWLDAQSEGDGPEEPEPAMQMSTPLQPPSLPPNINSLADFHSVRDQYEKWRVDYTKWHAQYSEWYSTVQISPPPPPPLR